MCHCKTCTDRLHVIIVIIVISIPYLLASYLIRFPFLHTFTSSRFLCITHSARHFQQDRETVVGYVISVTSYLTPARMMDIPLSRMTCAGSVQTQSVDNVLDDNKNFHGFYVVFYFSLVLVCNIKHTHKRVYYSHAGCYQGKNGILLLHLLTCDHLIYKAPSDSKCFKISARQRVADSPPKPTFILPNSLTFFFKTGAKSTRSFWSSIIFGRKKLQIMYPKKPCATKSFWNSANP